MSKIAIIAVVSTIACYFSIRYISNSRKKRRKSVVVNGIEGLVLNTPMVLIKSLSRLTGCEIYGKAEFLSVTGSPKGRLALAMIEKAERQGLISPHRGCTLFEGTVGSTGISLAVLARAKGYNCYIVMPGTSLFILRESNCRIDDQAKEKYNILHALGATVEKVRPCSIVDENHFVNVARQRAKEMNEKGGVARGYFCDQFENEANVAVSILMTTLSPDYPFRSIIRRLRQRYSSR